MSNDGFVNLKCPYWQWLEPDDKEHLSLLIFHKYVQWDIFNTICMIEH